MAEEKPNATISKDSKKGLCLIFGTALGFAALFAGKPTNYEILFICILIGAVGELIVLSIREAANEIVAQLKK